MNRPFAEAAEQNKQVIFDIIKPYLQGEALEIGSGTGQHAVYFASQVPEMCWQTSDLDSSLAGIEAWIQDSQLLNLPPPITLDVEGLWPLHQYDLIYSANCFHIMSKTAVAKTFEQVATHLKPGGVFFVYGPFNYGGEYTSESNARFDQSLKGNNPDSGIRDFEWVETLAFAGNMVLVQDNAMPANNRCLIWQNRTL